MASAAVLPVFFILLQVLCFCSGATPPYGPLSVSNGQLLGSSGQPVQLRGYSMYWPQWEDPSYWTADVIRGLACSWNCNVVRATLPAEGGQVGGYMTGGTTATKYLNMIYTVVDAAIANGMYVLIDWHLSEAIANQAEAKQFFSMVSLKYANVPNVLYETFNEPTNNYTQWSTIKAFHEAMIQAIRQNDPNAVIICGTPNMSSGPNQDVISNPISSAYKNIMYTLHWYCSPWPSWQDEQRQMIVTAKQAGLATFVTEYGVAWMDGVFYPDEATKWWTFMNTEKISYTAWHVGATPDGWNQFKQYTPTSQIGSDTNLTEIGRFMKNHYTGLGNNGMTCFSGGTSTSNGGVTVQTTLTNNWGGSTQYTLKFTNTGSKAVCSVTFSLTLASGQTIYSKWNIEDAGNGQYKLPSWARMNPGASIDSVGLVVSGTTAPKPAVVSVTNC